MARGSISGFTATSSAWNSVFSTATDGPANAFLIQNLSNAPANLLFRVTGVDGYLTTGLLEPGNLTVIRPGASGVSLVELKSSGADVTGHAYPQEWNTA